VKGGQGVGERSLLLVLSCWIVCTGVKKFLGGIFGCGVGILKDKYTPGVWLRRNVFGCILNVIIQKQYQALQRGSLTSLTHHQ
jgi:hypothetical protein